MTSFTRRAVVLAVLMLSAYALSVALTPTRYVVVKAEQLNLEALIPRQFGDWRMIEEGLQAIVNPQAQKTLDKLYSQVLSRSYVNGNGRRIMLSLAYGENQSNDSRIHRPEVCYPSQGFQITGKWKDAISFDSVELPVMRVVAQYGSRYEPVTYWIRVGDSLVRGAVEQTFARVSYGLTGRIPDGILFRVSEINQNTEDSISLQNQFIQALISSLTPAAKKTLIGSIGSQSVEIADKSSEL
ncbi:MAG: EpsI family protein [Betaproteobacteria bacterium]|nr:EpsI family protein [Betaproteobacteria bacterium]